jgi:pyruvate dehydrogenase E2 component (dihydrolipoamide acetyltransferase)
MSEFPYHLVVGMPALSPTMETGTLANWELKEGDSFSAGDVIAKIETDKATIDFEAQDDGCIAKILVPDGTQDVAVGAPIMVTVEDPEDAAAFKDYVLPEGATAAASPPPPTEKPAAAAAATHPAPPPPAPKKETPAAPPAAPVAPPPPPPPGPATTVPPIAASVAPTVGPAWGSTAKVTSPIAKTLSSKQKSYVELYGTTGQLPL